jgi:hypothetical protein
LKRSREAGKPERSLSIVFAEPHEHANPPRPLALLRARRDRPSRRAAEKANELTSPHRRTQAQGTALYRLKRAL